MVFVLKTLILSPLSGDLYHVRTVYGRSVFYAMNLNGLCVVALQSWIVPFFGKRSNNRVLFYRNLPNRCAS